MIKRYNLWIDRAFGLASDDELLKAQKRIVLSMLFIASPLVFGFIFFFFLNSEFFLYPGYIVLSFLTVSILNLLALTRWRKFNLFVWILVIAIILLAVGIHTVQGGFYKSSGTIMYALIAPAFAATGLGRKTGAIVLAIYFILIICLYLFESQISVFGPPAITDSIILMLVAINLSATGIFVLGTLFLLITETNNALIRADSLLLNILPDVVADELKSKGQVESRSYEQVTVLFSDFVGFTEIAAKVDPTDLVASIDAYYTGFDRIISNYGLEKIKTIGDAYMCAGGIPVERTDHASLVIKAARDIVNFVNNESGNSTGGRVKFQIRVGVHTGPVVAGIVGSKKWQYDIWGDTVNIASRMESNSTPGRINISETTYEAVRNEVDVELNAELALKGRTLQMYYLI